MKDKTLKKVNYGARNAILTIIIGFLLLLDLLGIIIGISQIREGHGPNKNLLDSYLKQSNYSHVLDNYLLYYNPDESYDADMQEIWAVAQYYEHASLYVAADACGDQTVASEEEAKMKDAYIRMGSCQKYAEDIVASLKK